MKKIFLLSSFLLISVFVFTDFRFFIQEEQDIEITDEINNVVGNYLSTFYEIDDENEIQFETYKIYHGKEIKGNIIIYMYTMMEIYNKEELKENMKTKGSNSSPSVITLNNINGEYKVIKYELPEYGGELYEDSIKKIFKNHYKKYKNDIFSSHEDLQGKIDMKIKQWIINNQ